MSKAKFKINQLAAKPVDVDLIHPTEGLTGIVVKLVGPHSRQFKDAYEAFKNSEQTVDDNLLLFVSCVIGWDEEAFEMPYSTENAMKLFKNPENAWIAECIAPVMRDSLQFFRTEG
jgi:hypothetical protein